MTTRQWASAALSMMVLLAGQSGTSRAEGASFAVHHGINLAGPFARVQKLAPPGKDGQILDYSGFARRPLPYSPSELRGMGFDFIRLAVNPVPLLKNPPAVRPRLLADTEQGVQIFLDANMRVIYDLHFWKPEDDVWTDASVIDGRNPAQFPQYQQLVTEVARRLSRYPQGQVALELLNEPPKNAASEQRWFMLQGQLVQAVRRVAPSLPIVVTGLSGTPDSLENLKRSDLDFGDPNLVYTFHFYEPLLFTHQGLPNPPYRDAVGLPYPANRGQQADSLARALTRIDSEKLEPAEKDRAKDIAAQAMRGYFSTPPDAGFMARRLDPVIAWAKANNIPASRLVMGEFGALNLLDSDTPERRAARQAWNDDVRKAADARGIAWAYWALGYSRGPIFQ